MHKDGQGALYTVLEGLHQELGHGSEQSYIVDMVQLEAEILLNCSHCKKVDYI